MVLNNHLLNKKGRVQNEPIKRLSLETNELHIVKRQIPGNKNTVVRQKANAYSSFFNTIMLVIGFIQVSCLIHSKPD